MSGVEVQVRSNGNKQQGNRSGIRGKKPEQHLSQKYQSENHIDQRAEYQEKLNYEIIFLLTV